MRVVIQRVAQASVEIENKIIGKITHGLLVLVGIEEDDQDEDINWLCHKLIHLRIFADTKGAMNLSVLERGGDLLVISQFTLYAKTKKGNRPSFIKAARPEIAIPIYTKFIQKLELLSNKPIATGVFGASMQVSLVNDGPVTLIIDSKERD